MDIKSFVDQMNRDGTLVNLANARAVAFGPPARPYLGQSLLPERQVPENMYQETTVRYTSVIANDGGRYSPVQIKSTGEMVGSMQVVLGDQDIGAEFTARDYDALLAILAQAPNPAGGPAMSATMQLMNWTENVLVRALTDRIEVQRWQALLDASVVRKGDNGYQETVSYPNPSGHRAATGGTWSSDAYDPYTDIAAMDDLLRGKGFRINRIVTSNKVMNILANNDKIKQRWGPIRVLSSTELLLRMGTSQVSAGMQADGLPAPETYDAFYRALDGVHRFIPDTVMAFFATTGRDENVINPVQAGSTYDPIQNVLGYTAIGRAAGEQGAGRVVRLFAKDDKPPRIEGQAWQTSLPVVLEPEAMAVITGIG